MFASSEDNYSPHPAGFNGPLAPPYETVEILKRIEAQLKTIADLLAANAPAPEPQTRAQKLANLGSKGRAK